MNVENDTVWACVDSKGNALGGYNNPLNLCGSEGGAKQVMARQKKYEGCPATLKVQEFKLVLVTKEY